jgi:hypothetical protein
MITTRYGCLLRKSEVTPGVCLCVWVLAVLGGVAGVAALGWGGDEGEREEKTSQLGLLGPLVFGPILGL